jgi:hypothetical protein
VPDGCALFDEGPRAFARVFAGRQAGRDLVLARERVRVVEVLCRAQDLLDGRQGKRRVALDLAGIMDGRWMAT